MYQWISLNTLCPLNATNINETPTPTLIPFFIQNQANILYFDNAYDFIQEIPQIINKEPIMSYI